MPGSVSYDPSVGTLFHAALPDAPVHGDAEGLRRRVSWPARIRATGLGVIHGGEVVLVPPERVPEVIRALPHLIGAGIAALVLAGTEIAPPSGVPVAVVPAGTDLRAVQEAMEAFIMRRRRELFDLAQSLHRQLVEAAIGGAPLPDLLQVAGQFGRRAVLDREGEVIGAALDGNLLVAARMATHGTDEVLWMPEHTMVAAPVVAGRERRGLILVVGVDQASLDEDQLLAHSLAAASAIALARSPQALPPRLDIVLSSNAVPAGGVSWRALALSADVPLARLARAVAAEMEGRNAAHHLARREDSIVVLTPAEVNPAALRDAVVARLGSAALRVGVGRGYVGADGLRRAVDEALAALEYASAGNVTLYEAVEVTVLLRAVPGREAFVTARLGPLLEESTAARDLKQTLQVYLQSGRNVSEAARVLHVHRNTLLYRLQRIRELLAADLDDAEQVFALDLALHLLAAGQPPTGSESIG